MYYAERGIIVSILISRINQELLVKLDYSKERISKIKSLPERQWDADKKVWRLPYSQKNLNIIKKMFCNEQQIITFEE